MKQVRNLAWVFLAVITIVSCAKKEEVKEDDVEWKEMDDFHTVMADMYHPLKDSNNLAPIRQEAAMFAAAASKWAQSPLPSKVDNAETKELLSQLDSGAKELEQLVGEQASDEVVGAKLTALHDVFHHIMEKWHKKSEEKHEH